LSKRGITCIKQLAERYLRYGYTTLHNMLKTKDLVVNPKRSCPLYLEEDLQVRTRRGK